MLNETIRSKLLQFCDHEMEPPAFEAWAYAAQDLEAQVGHGAYLDLISADYQGGDVEGVRDLCASILDQHHAGILARYRARRILQAMLADTAAVVPGLQKLVALRHAGNDFIPIEFVGFDDEIMDELPTTDRRLWNATALAELLVEWDRYFRYVQQACQELLDDLRRRHPDDV